jgi:hypothetical protein
MPPLPGNVPPPPGNPPPLGNVPPPPGNPPPLTVSRTQVGVTTNSPSSTVVTVDSVDVDAKRTSAEGKFSELAAVDKPGKGIWKIGATWTYRPSGPVEVPGSNFNEACPGQPHVNRRIVEAKIEAGMPATPVIPVVVSPQTGDIVMSDKHHTFVACMAMGRPVKFGLLEKGLASMGKVRTSWMECTWKGFEKPGAAARGFSLTPKESQQLEGERTANPDWQNIVPWRKDTPQTDDGKVTSLKQSMSTINLGDELEKACAVNGTLAAKLYELLNVDLVQVVSRVPPRDSTGGDWDAENNTIYVDNNLGPLETVDMLIFEAHNAMHESEYNQLQHRAYEERMGVAEFGEEKAKIEAAVTIEYVEHLIGCKNANQALAPNGRRALEAVDAKLPGYSTMTPQDRQARRDDLVQLIIDTPHGGSGVALPKRTALSTKELYAYEQAAYTQGVKGIVGFYRDKIPKIHPQRQAFLDAFKTIQAGPGDPSWAGKFYDICSQHANRIFALNVPEFTNNQRTVAQDEYQQAGGNWEQRLIATLSGLQVQRD